MSNRINKINEEILRELASLIRELKDPRIHGILSLTRVDTTGDLRYAKVYFSVMDDSRSTDDVLKGLRSASGYLRREIGRRLTIRQTPELIFERDFSLDRGSKVLDLMSEVMENNGENERYDEK